MSITSVTYQPKRWQSGYNPIIWAVNSNQNTQVDMKYVFDVSVNGTTGGTGYTYRVKQRPNPTGYGMIDVSSLAQPYIQLTNINPELVTTQYRAMGLTIMPFVHVKVGEEYLSNGTMTIFNGSGATGSPNYFLSPFGATGQQVRVIPSALTYNQQMGVMTATTTANPFWSDYIMDGNGKFLSQEPGRRKVRFTDRHTLTFLNQYDNTLGSFANTVQGILVVTKNKAGTVLGQSFYENLVVNGGGPQTAASYTSTTESRNTDIIAFRCGPVDLGFSNPSIYTYEITAYYKNTSTSSTIPQAVASETVVFEIMDDCQDLYQNVRLSWLNNLGGRDYYNFNMFNEKTTTSNYETYNQFPLRWNSTSPVSTFPDQPIQNWGGDKIFNKSVDSTFQIQTDFLTQDYVDFLANIPESSSVWAYFGDDYNTPYTMIIDNVEYTYKNVKQTKLVQATFTCRYTKNQIKQNL